MSTTFFDNIKRDFKDVSVSDTGAIDTSEFLEASESLVTLFDLLGSSAFAVVQNDMTGNIKKIRARQLKKPLNSQSLQDIVLDEKNEKPKDATQGLLWLSRGLAFTALAIRNSINNPSEELSVSFINSYKNTLTKYHNMLIRPIFKLAMNACPYRKDFYAKLGEDQAKVLEQLTIWLEALERIVKIIEEFYASGNYGKGL